MIGNGPVRAASSILAALLVVSLLAACGTAEQDCDPPLSVRDAYETASWVFVAEVSPAPHLESPDSEVKWHTFNNMVDGSATLKGPQPGLYKEPFYSTPDECSDEPYPSGDPVGEGLVLLFLVKDGKDQPWRTLGYRNGAITLGEDGFDGYLPEEWVFPDE